MPSEQIALQKVGQKDMRAVVEFLRQFGDVNDVRLIKRLEPRVHSPAHLLLLARIGRLPVGLIECVVREREALLDTGNEGVILFLAVAQAHRRQKIATRLIETAGFWFSGNGVSRIYSEVPAEDKETQTFFKSQGFDKTNVNMTREYP